MEIFGVLSDFNPRFLLLILGSKEDTSKKFSLPSPLVSWDSLPSIYCRLIKKFFLWADYCCCLFFRCRCRRDVLHLFPLLWSTLYLSLYYGYKYHMRSIYYIYYTGMEQRSKSYVMSGRSLWPMGAGKLHTGE